MPSAQSYSGPQETTPTTASAEMSASAADRLTSAASLEPGHRTAARHAVGQQLAERLRSGARVEQPVAHESQQIFELVLGQIDRRAQDRIEPIQDGLDRPRRSRRSSSTPAATGSYARADAIGSR